MKKTLIAAALLTAFGIASAEPERIDYGYPTNNGYYGQADYFIEFANNQLVISSDLSFSISGITQWELDFRKPFWEEAIESMWSEQFDIVSGSERYPILVDVQFDGPIFNHSVTIQHGYGRSNEFLWYTGGGDMVVAHEFGHMLGLFDEYRGGGTDPSGEIIDPSSIMGSTSLEAVAYARHYEGFMDWLAGKNPEGHYSLAQHIEWHPVPEPTTLALMAVGLVLLWRRR